MDRMNNNKGTPTKRTGGKNETSDQNIRNVDQVEIEQPKRNEVPSFPEEMPVREAK